MAVSQTDREHQRVIRDLRQQGQAAVTWGLPNPATEATVLGMGLVIRERMSSGTGSDRASAAAELASVMLDKTMHKMPQASAVQCAKGCSFCCHTAVSVSAPEVFRIVRLIEANDAGSPLGREAVVQRAKARAASTIDAVMMLRDACPLLVEGNCGVYENRPMGCRQFVSTSMEGCRSAAKSGNGNLPFVPAAANAGVIVRSLLLGAAASLGLPVDTYELSSALVVALETPDAEARWLAGEDVLAKALKVPPAPKMRESSARWATMLRDLYN